MQTDINQKSTSETNNGSTVDTSAQNQQQQNQQQSGEQNSNSNPSTDSNIEVIEVEIKQDNDGNIIDDNNNILVKKDDIKYDENKDIILPANFQTLSTPPIVNEFTKLQNKFKEDYGFSFTGENDEEIKFDFNKQEDRISFFESSVENATKGLLELERNTLYEEYPDVKDYIELRQRGYTKEEIYNNKLETDFTNIKLDKNNVQQLKDIINQSLKLKNVSEKTINTTLKALELDNELFETAKESLLEINEYKNSLEKTRNNQKLENEKLQKQQAVQFKQQIENIIKTKSLGKITIGDEDVQGFSDYIFKPINNKNQTQSILDSNNLDTSFQLMFEYLKYKKFDLSNIVNKAINTEKVKILKAKKVSHEGNNNNSNQQVNKGALDEFSFGKLFANS